MRCDNRVRNYKMGYSATYPMGVVCRKKWGSDGVWSDGVGVGEFDRIGWMVRVVSWSSRF